MDSHSGSGFHRRDRTDCQRGCTGRREWDHFLPPGQPDGEEIASVEVAETGEVTLPLAAANEEAALEIHELGYNTVDSAVTAEGVHDLYVVFGAKDLHAAAITLLAE